MEEIGSRVSESGGSNESLSNTSSPNDTSEVKANVDTSKKRKGIEPRAACWKHFDKLTDENGAPKAKYKHCGKVYAAATKGKVMNGDGCWEARRLRRCAEPLIAIILFH